MLWQDPPSQFWVLNREKKYNKHKNSLYLIWFGFVLKQNYCLCYSRSKWGWMYKCCLNFGEERGNVYFKRAGFNSEISILDKGMQSLRALDALRTVLCVCVKATALIFQTLSGIFFLLLYTEKLSAQSCNLSFSNFFSVLQLPATFSHPALTLQSWVIASCFLPSTSNCCPSLILHNKLGATVPVARRWLSILSVPIEWKEISGLVQ